MCPNCAILPWLPAWPESPLHEEPALSLLSAAAAAHLGLTWKAKDIVLSLSLRLGAWYQLCPARSLVTMSNPQVSNLQWKTKSEFGFSKEQPQRLQEMGQ